MTRPTPEEIRARVDARQPRVSDDGHSINPAHVALESSLRTQYGYPAWIHALDGPGRFRPTPALVGDDWLPAGTVGPEHLGWWFHLRPMREPARLLAIEHGGPFTVPPEVPDDLWPPTLGLVPGRTISASLSTHLIAQPAGPRLAYHLWCTPGERVSLVHPDHPALEHLL